MPTTRQQISQHLSGSSADPDALYMIWGGANDISAVAGEVPEYDRLVELSKRSRKKLPSFVKNLLNKSIHKNGKV